MKNYSTDQLLSIQYLRGIAAIAVVLYHIRSRAESLGYNGYWPSWLQGGVDLFFVISGFIMVVTVHRAQKSSLEFMKDRIKRIVPIYWFFTSIAVILSGEFGAHAITSYFFIPYPHPVENEMWPVLIPGWTLNYEMYFYLIFATCLTLPGRALIPTSIAIITAVILFDKIFETKAIMEFYSDTIVLEFALGMLIASKFISGGRVGHWSFIILGAIFMLMPIPLVAGRFITLGIPVALIFSGTLSIEGKLPNYKLLKLLGDSSYSLYLSHGFSLIILLKIWSVFELSWQTFIPFSLVICTGLGIAVFIGLERPMGRVFGKNRRFR